jgi:hypothetical protein
MRRTTLQHYLKPSLVRPKDDIHAVKRTARALAIMKTTSLDMSELSAIYLVYDGCRYRNGSAIQIWPRARK